MDLSSTLFLFLFLPVFLLIYLVSTQRLRLPIILVASVIFLTWGREDSFMVVGRYINFRVFGGLAIAKAKEKGNHSPKWLWVGVGINLAILSFFKFSAAYGENGFARFHLPQNWIAPVAGLAVPIGLSYVTFQMISYLVDVWKGNTPVEKNFIALSAYLLFFPKTYFRTHNPLQALCTSDGTTQPFH